MKNRIFTLLAVCCLCFAACKKDDPCENISCLNGGTCANGACNCPTGYMGSDCSQQETPNRIHITQISVLDFNPVKDSGNSWDFSNGPDVYVALSLQGTVLADNRENALINAIFPPLNWSLGTAFVMEEPSNQYTLSLIDKDDFPPDEFMTGINFTPYNSQNGFPVKDTIQCSNCPAIFEVTYNYDF